MKRMIATFVAALGFCFAASTQAQDRGYTEGTVTDVSAIQVTPGHFDEYMAYIRNEWKPTQEALKKAGLIVDYAVYGTARRRPEDPDLYLCVTYANMAALDGFDDKADPIVAKLTGGHTKEQKGVSDRNSYRKILGDELIRELKIK